MTAMRQLVGEVLRARRVSQGLTLRDVSGRARVSLGYISEVERGQKEASSELLAALASALDVPLSKVLLDVSSLLEVEEAAEAQIASISTITGAAASGVSASAA
ncbi:MAG: transcriptional regulator [Aeromicrobium sp.]|nr:transcriptional regulator [Aeromicrobium sp.]